MAPFSAQTTGTVLYRKRTGTRDSYFPYSAIRLTEVLNDERHDTCRGLDDSFFTIALFFTSNVIIPR